MSKLKAYTISELVVVMVLTAIVISIAGSVFLMIKKQYSMYQTKNRKCYDLSLFTYLINRDIENAEQITWADNELNLIQSSKEYVYGFEDEYVTRQQLQLIDTFYFKTIDLNIKFLENTSWVTHFSCDLQFENKIHSLYLHKKYTPNTLLNADIRK